MTSPDVTDIEDTFPNNVDYIPHNLGSLSVEEDSPKIRSRSGTLLIV